ncbi:MAG TPA: hypothetical protein VNT01_00580 [Symbiobacteriaceae bacterium]|nr:hypothetical protein [Symbiobacteriaceae bacterium]
MTQDHAGALRRTLAVAATQYAQRHAVPYYVSKGAPPKVLFHPHGQDRHGNFLPATYQAIIATPDWKVRLDKVHTQRSALPQEHQTTACELDSSTSSDALLMNLFCHPKSADAPLLAALFGLPTIPPLKFGRKPLVPLKGERFDETELDMQLGLIHVESKLTESDFTEADLTKVLTYEDAGTVFDLAALTTPSGKVLHYQLIRNVLAIFRDEQRRFVLLADRRRPDLAEAWQTVMAAVRDPALRARCRLITWQEAAFCAPAPVRAFLREKYAIEPAVPRGIASGTGHFDITTANRALSTLYGERLQDLFAELGGAERVSNPLLVEAQPGYGAVQTRLMVVGQQTFGWEGALGQGVGDDPVGRLMQAYRDYRVGANWRSTPFWQAAYELYGLLNPAGPDEGFIWSNLIKVDQGGYRPEPEVEVAARRLFGVLPDEVAILEPDVVAFFTGPGYDRVLRRLFPGVVLFPCEGYDVEDLARVVHPLLPARTYRTHHPRTLRMNHKWAVVEAIAAESQVRS